MAREENQRGNRSLGIPPLLACVVTKQTQGLRKESKRVWTCMCLCLRACVFFFFSVYVCVCGSINGWEEEKICSSMNGFYCARLLYSHRHKNTHINQFRRRHCSPDPRLWISTCSRRQSISRRKQPKWHRYYPLFVCTKSNQTGFNLPCGCCDYAPSSLW